MSIRKIFSSIAALVTAAVIAIVLGLSIMDRSEAQDCGKSKPCVENVPSAQAGTVRIHWVEAPGATNYRVGWLHKGQYLDLGAGDNPQWLNLFSFRDLEPAGAEWIDIPGLEPGAEYYFISAAMTGGRFGGASWTEWAELRVTDAPAVAACPTHTGGEPNAPPATTQVTATPTPTMTPTPTVALSPTPIAQSGRAPDSVESSTTSANVLANLTLTIGGLEEDFAEGSSVELYLDEAFQVPAAIPGDSVYFAVTNPVTESTGSGYPRPAHGGVEVVSPHTGPSTLRVIFFDYSYGSDYQGPVAGQTLQLVVSKAAGIKTPFTAGSYSVGYSVLSRQSASRMGPQYSVGFLTVNAKIALSDETGPIGHEVVAQGSGFRPGTTAMLKVLHPDATSDDLAGLVESWKGEEEACQIILEQGTELASGQVGPTGVVLFGFTVSNPPFRTGGENFLCATDSVGTRSVTDVEEFEVRQPATATRTGFIDYDRDDDGLIEISSLAQLDSIRYDLSADGSVTVTAYPKSLPQRGCPSRCRGYELTADLDFDTNGNGRADAGDEFWNDGRGWVPIGRDVEREDTPYIWVYSYFGVLDGNGFEIRNLWLSYEDRQYMGLFARLDRFAKVSNLVLPDVNVEAADRVGALAGQSYGSIADVSVSGVVACMSSCGGLVGENLGAIRVSSSSVNVGNVPNEFGHSQTYGSLVGRNNGLIESSYATGDIAAEGTHAGGLVGSLSASHEAEHPAEIIDSYATGDIRGLDGTSAGGLVGMVFSGAVRASYATGSIAAGHSVGGLAGSVYEEGLIVDSYSTGKATGTWNTGGLVGTAHIGGKIRNSYTTSRVVGPPPGARGGLIGGYAGSPADATASYWDVGKTGQQASIGGEPKTTAELQTPTSATGIYADWDPAIWDFGTSKQYPALNHGEGSVERQCQ